MKLRIRGNSIRLRLTRSEIAQFGQTGKVEETVRFGLAKPGLRYQLHAWAGDEKIRAQFEDNCLLVSIPVSIAEAWIKSEQVGIEAVQLVGDDMSLRILVEKDFACVTARSGEDETDAFPNPLAERMC